MVFLLLRNSVGQDGRNARVSVGCGESPLSYGVDPVSNRLNRPQLGREICEKKKQPVKALWGDLPDIVAGHIRPPAGLWFEMGRPGNLG
jgi:hypothetical protein